MFEECLVDVIPGCVSDIQELICGVTYPTSRYEIEGNSSDSEYGDYVDASSA
jgi:hypothetical protein